MKRVTLIFLLLIFPLQLFSSFESEEALLDALNEAGFAEVMVLPYVYPVLKVHQIDEIGRTEKLHSYGDSLDKLGVSVPIPQLDYFKWYKNQKL